MTMRFLCLYKPKKQESVAPSQQEMAEMGNLIDQMTKSGVLLATGGILPSATGARVQLAGGKLTVIDAVTEQERVGGFALIQVKSKEEAVEHVKGFLKVAGDGECEIRQLFEA
jgi:hypothetical protein